MVSEFDIEYNVKNFSLIQELNDTISKTGHLNNMPLELVELTTKYGRQPSFVLVISVKLISFRDLAKCFLC